MKTMLGRTLRALLLGCFGAGVMIWGAPGAAAQGPDYTGPAYGPAYGGPMGPGQPPANFAPPAGYGQATPGGYGQAMPGGQPVSYGDPSGYGDPSQYIDQGGSCDSCNTCDACCPPCCGITGGVGFYYFRPYFDSNTAFVTTVNQAPADVTSPSARQTTTDFNWNYSVSPLVWLGMTTDTGLGGRVRWFQFDQNSQNTVLSNTFSPLTTITASPNLPSPVQPNVPGTFVPGNINVASGAATFPLLPFRSPGFINRNTNGGSGPDAITFGSGLKIVVIDAEATHTINFRQSQLILSGGGRYLHMNQTYFATLNNSNTIGANTATEAYQADYDHSFNGAGTTMALQFRRPFGQSGFTMFGSARGSLLVGRGRQNLVVTENIVDPGSAIQVGQNFTTNPPRSFSSHGPNNNLMPVAEIEFGFEYGVNIWDTFWFTRVAAANQNYFDAGNASSTHGNLGLVGFTVQSGITY